MTALPMPALAVTVLTKSFGGLRVTNGVDLAIAPGERRLIIGPNGAGKTTLFNLITGELAPDAGSIALFGQALNPRFASEIRLLTGALPAQYGYRTAGVVDIHTKGSDYAEGGAIDLLGGSAAHREASGEASGHAGALSYYATVGYLRDERAITIYEHLSEGTTAAALAISGTGTSTAPRK